MSQPVKLSDALVLDARIAAKAQVRSIAGQVEFWAKLGRSIEALLSGQQAMLLCRTMGATPLSELVNSVNTTKGKERLKAYLESEPYPHFKAHPTQSGLLVRIDANGLRTTGRFVNRVFVTVEASNTQKRGSVFKTKPQNARKSLAAKAASVRIKDKSVSKSKERQAWA